MTSGVEGSDGQSNRRRRWRVSEVEMKVAMTLPATRATTCPHYHRVSPCSHLRTTPSPRGLLRFTLSRLSSFLSHLYRYAAPIVVSILDFFFFFLLFSWDCLLHLLCLFLLHSILSLKLTWKGGRRSVGYRHSSPRLWRIHLRSFITDIARWMVVDALRHLRFAPDVPEDHACRIPAFTDLLPFNATASTCSRLPCRH